MPHRHPTGDLLIGQLQLRQHLDDRRVEVDQAFVDQLHHQRGVLHLCDRADLEHRIVGGGDLDVDVEHTGRGRHHLVGVLSQNAKCRACEALGDC